MSAFRRAAAPPPTAVAAAQPAQPTAAEAPSPAPAYTPALPGTRRWVDGQLLTSTGNTHLDGFLGGGVPLGSLVLLEEDAHGVHAATLARLFAAEGVACGHALALVSAAGRARQREWLASLPANVSRDSRDVAAAAAAGQELLRARQRAAAAGGDDCSDSSDSDGEDGSAQPPPRPAAAARVPQSVKVGHSFDLHRRIHPHVLEQAGVATVSVGELLAAGGGGDEDSGSSAQALYSALFKRVTDTAASTAAAPATVHRLLIDGLGSPCWPGYTGRDAPALLAACGSPQPGAAARAPHAAAPDADALPRADAAWDAHAPMLRFVAALRGWLQSPPGSAPGGSAAAGDAAAPARRPSVVLLSVPTHLLPLAAAARLRAYCDLVVKVHAFGDPPLALATGLRDAAAAAAAQFGGTGGASTAVVAPEFAGYAGLLFLRRLPRTGGLAPPGNASDTDTLAFARDKRRMLVEKPHVPPEGEAGGSSVAAAAAAAADGKPATRSLAAAGLGCATSTVAAAGGGGTSVLDF